MNVIYIRFYSSHSQTLRLPIPASEKKENNNTSRRGWKVAIQVNDLAPTVAHIQDPFLDEKDYVLVFEGYLPSSGRPRGKAESSVPGKQLVSETDELDNISLKEERIEKYGRELFDQLEQQTELFTPGFGNDISASETQIYVVEHYDSNPTSEVVGIHCLAWELLESVRIPHLPNLRLRVTRVSDFPSCPDIPSPPDLPSPQTAQPLAAIQADPNAVFTILLVIARDFRLTGAERDPEPDLAQWPLMNLQKRLRSRLTLEIVRPGSLEELEQHLMLRWNQKVTFNVIHFDLHGLIVRDEIKIADMIPYLLFARKPVLADEDFSIPLTKVAKAKDVAEVLSRFRIENVVLNACLSAYNQTRPASNLAHTFLRYGISNVSAMWSYVHWKTVTTYVHAFYDNLLVKDVNFHIAAQRAREALRQQPTILKERAYQDFFLCLNYARNVQKTDSMLQKSSRSPSIRPHDSSISASHGSVTSSRGGGLWPSSRLGDSRTLGDASIMRLQLHLLELEYKLVTFKIVYASDFGQPKSELKATMDKMVNMWLNTNLIDEVHYYKAKEFGRKIRSGSAYMLLRDKRTRTSQGGPLKLKSIRQRLYIVREVDSAIDPGFQADKHENSRLEERRSTIEEGLKSFAKQLHADDHSYLIFLGSQNVEWWRSNLKKLNGQWWVNAPWGLHVGTRSG
ncbi:hypothetical protein E4U55_000152 [Claviceps digitariae]|nr:hypothetical protein E4U55_000152 [Claviceps digitariae]